jgi:hypothetical protein
VAGTEIVEVRPHGVDSGAILFYMAAQHADRLPSAEGARVGVRVAG